MCTPSITRTVRDPDCSLCVKFSNSNIFFLVEIDDISALTLMISTKDKVLGTPGLTSRECLGQLVSSTNGNVSSARKLKRCLRSPSQVLKPLQLSKVYSASFISCILGLIRTSICL
jgi:hypothetical protein